MTRTMFVLSTSRAAAERHAALDPDVWFETEAAARDWLEQWEARQDQRETALLFQVYEARQVVTHDGMIWTARLVERELAGAA